MRISRPVCLSLVLALAALCVLAIPARAHAQQSAPESAHAHPQTHTNPINLEPLVGEAFERFHNLDFPGAVARFEQVRAQHPGDPQATA
ncbi:MAG: hypothetical protein ACRD2D_08455, partial [Terriglobales bacterium]